MKEWPIGIIVFPSNIRRCSTTCRHKSEKLQPNRGIKDGENTAGSEIPANPFDEALKIDPTYNSLKLNVTLRY